MSECIGEGCDHVSHKKTSAWSDAEREQPAAAAEPAPPQVPLWATTFAPGTVLSHAGWSATVRHVGCEEGHWFLVLTEPFGDGSRPTRAMKRAEYRRLKRTVGKRKAKEALRDRKPTK